MNQNFDIRCRITPSGDEGVLIPSLEGPSVLSLHINPMRSCPRGINIDGTVIFDMQEDGGVDQIEILYYFGKGLKLAKPGRNWGESYWRLYLNAWQDQFDGFDSTPAIEVASDNVTIKFNETDCSKAYPIGPSIRALIKKERLVGITISALGKA